MNAKIVIRKKIKAKTIEDAMRTIKKKYSRARLVTYKFDKNFKFERPKEYDRRTMTVVFVDDCSKVWL